MRAHQEVAITRRRRPAIDPAIDKSKPAGSLDAAVCQTAYIRRMRSRDDAISVIGLFVIFVVTRRRDRNRNAAIGGDSGFAVRCLRSVV